MWKYLNKEIPTLIAIWIIAVLVILVGGFTWWQYAEIEKERTDIPEVRIPDKEEKEKSEEETKEEVVIVDFEVALVDFECDEIDKDTDWNICRNEDYKLEFKKPEGFSWIKNVAIVSDCDYVAFQEDCSDVDDLILAFEKETGCSESCLKTTKDILSYWGDKYRVNINNTSFCFYGWRDCGAGSCGAKRYHLMIKEKDCYLIHSHYWRSNCGTGFGPGTEDYKNCIEKQENEDTIFEEVISTFRFLD